jgi:hypothetical protein
MADDVVIGAFAGKAIHPSSALIDQNTPASRGSHSSEGSRQFHWRHYMAIEVRVRNSLFHFY